MRWDDLHDGLLAQMVEAGMTENQIAENMGCTRMAVNNRKKKLGIKHKAAVYAIRSPGGEISESRSLSDFARSNWRAMEESGEPPAEDIRRSKPCIGLEWALRTGREWKGWSVRLLSESTKPGRRKQ